MVAADSLISDGVCTLPGYLDNSSGRKHVRVSCDRFPFFKRDSVRAPDYVSLGGRPLAAAPGTRTVRCGCEVYSLIRVLGR